MPNLSFALLTVVWKEVYLGMITLNKNCPAKLLAFVACIVGISFGEVAAQSSSPNLTDKKIANLDLGEVRQHLPGQAIAANRKNQRKLFERLGGLRREAALDEIVDRYAHQPQAESFILDAWGSAITGWMSVDPEGASSALLQLARGTVDLTDSADSRASVRWKDSEIVIAGDFGFSPIQQMLGRGIRAATEVDPELGMKLLSNSDLLGDKVYWLLHDYTESLGQDTDWLQLEQELNRLLDERGRPDYAGTHDVVTTAISHGWARWDLDAALQWSINKLGNDRTAKQNHALSVLWYLEADPSVVINWLEENRRPESIVDDDFLAAYCERVRPGDYLNQIVGRVKSPQIREQIVKSFIEPRGSTVGQLKNDGDYRVAKSRVLRGLIEAANLPPDRVAHWNMVVRWSEQYPLKQKFWLVNYPDADLTAGAERVSPEEFAGNLAMLDQATTLRMVGFVGIQNGWAILQDWRMSFFSRRPIVKRLMVRLADLPAETQARLKRLDGPLLVHETKGKSFFEMGYGRKFDRVEHRDKYQTPEEFYLAVAAELRVAEKAKAEAIKEFNWNKADAQHIQVALGRLPGEWLVRLSRVDPATVSDKEPVILDEVMAAIEEGQFSPPDGKVYWMYRWQGAPVQR